MSHEKYITRITISLLLKAVSLRRIWKGLGAAERASGLVSSVINHGWSRRPSVINHGWGAAPSTRSKFVLRMILELGMWKIKIVSKLHTKTILILP